jgi:[ribosomal protein S18]-alanine N-acetyltransferase
MEVGGIRRARLSDMGAILSLESQFPGDRMSARSVRRFIGSPTASVQVLADLTGRVLGALVLLFRRGSRAARIYSVAVDASARGRGFGAALVDAAERTARNRRCTAVSLEVREDNAAAIMLYRKQGYGVIATLPGYYEDGTTGLRLRKRL